MEAAVTVLEPFAAVQKLIEGDKYPTSSILLGVVTDLRRNLSSLIGKTGPNSAGHYGHHTYELLHEPLKLMYEDFVSRWGTGEDVVGDPETGVGNRPFGITKVLSPS